MHGRSATFTTGPHESSPILQHIRLSAWIRIRLLARSLTSFCPLTSTLPSASKACTTAVQPFLLASNRAVHPSYSTSSYQRQRKGGIVMSCPAAQLSSIAPPQQQQQYLQRQAAATSQPLHNRIARRLTLFCELTCTLGSASRAWTAAVEPLPLASVRAVSPLYITSSRQHPIMIKGGNSKSSRYYPSHQQQHRDTYAAHT